MGVSEADNRQGEGSVELSVVVCSIGHAGLERTVASLVASAEAARVRIEVVVVWQGHMVPPRLDGPVRVVDVFPLGLSYARNRGIAVVQAPLVGFVDDDEVVDEGWVGAVLSSLARPGVAGIFGAVLSLDDEGVPHCLFEVDEERFFSGTATVPWVVGTGGNMAFRRAPLVEAGCFDPLFGVGAEAKAADESELIARLLRSGHTLAWSPGMVVYHPTKAPSARLASRYPYGFGMGRVVRRHRAPLIGAKYMKATLHYLLGGLRAGDSQQSSEAAQTVSGFVAGVWRPVAPASPRAVLDRAPEEVRRELAGASLEPQYVQFDGVPRLRYRSGDRRLDVYVAAPDDLERSLGARSDVRALERDRDALWVVSERSAER
jgi:hypothetical protein